MKIQKRILPGLPLVAGISATAGILATPLQAREMPSQQPPRPNIIVILADDMGYSDPGCFGGELRTPNIDRLAKNGVAFTQFYNQARCCPTRAALMTGRYPHQVGIGEMIDPYAAGAREAAGSPAYSDHLSTASPTIAEILRAAGYTTLMSGKWHLGHRPSEWPVHRGFDRSFVLVGGAMNFFGGDSKEGPRTAMAIDDKPWAPHRDSFYSTDAFTDLAIEFINQAVKQSPEKPFFLYLPHNAVHWPLQAPEADIEKYKGAYDHGWQAVRETRLQRMIRLGILPPGHAMTPMDTGKVPAWNDLADDERKRWSRLMEVYAAQAEIMDRNIGRLLDELERLGIEQNTLVIFLSDNGGAAEDPGRGNKNVPIGHRDSYRGYGRPWATVSNTPWRNHKVTACEGGISTCFIARWPAGIPAAINGSLVREPAHIIDLMPTFVALSGAKYPSSIPVEGCDITPMIKGGPGDKNRTFFWEHQGNCAIRKGPWKLVSIDYQHEKRDWALYNIENDRIESTDLSKKHPAIARELLDEYKAWAKRCGVIDRALLVSDNPGKNGKN